jgi:hypothetical protein
LVEARRDRSEADETERRSEAEQSLSWTAEETAAGYLAELDPAAAEQGDEGNAPPAEKPVEGSNNPGEGTNAGR